MLLFTLDNQGIRTSFTSEGCTLCPGICMQETAISRTPQQMVSPSLAAPCPGRTKTGKISTLTSAVGRGSLVKIRNTQNSAINHFPFRSTNMKIMLLGNCYFSIPKVHTSLPPTKDNVLSPSHKHNKPTKAECHDSRTRQIPLISELSRKVLLGE